MKTIQISWSILAAALLFGVVACAPHTASLDEEYKGVMSPDEQPEPAANLQTFQYLMDTPASLDTETMLSEISKEVAGKVYYGLKEEGEKSLNSRIAVVAAVPLADLKKDTEFGRVLAEFLLTDLADRGLKVTELRLGKEINILPRTGEFIMSRNIGELVTDLPELNFVVMSTFTNTRKNLIVQGRLVDLKTGLMKTSWRYAMPLNRELLGLFQMERQPHTIAIKGIKK